MWSDQSCEQALAAPICQRESGGMTTPTQTATPTAESTSTQTPTPTTQETTEAVPSNETLFLTGKIFGEQGLPSECSLFTYGKCQPSQDELVDTYPLPESEGAINICQEICQIVEACKYFTYDRNEELCFLYHYRYLDSCDLIGGLAEPSLDTCEQEFEDSCDSFVNENCEYEGELVLEKADITDAHACQQLLNTIGFVYAADYFVYDSVTRFCSFYSGTLMTCYGVNGPDYPDLDTCQVSTTVTTEETTILSTEPVTTIEKFDSGLWFGNRQSGGIPGPETSIYYISGNSSCILPDFTLPLAGSNLVAVSYGSDIYVCGYNPLRNSNKLCYVSHKSNDGREWRQISDMHFEVKGDSNGVIVGSTFLSLSWNYHQRDPYQFETLDLTSDDASWELRNWIVPEVPEDYVLYGSCTVALSNEDVMVIGGTLYNPVSSDWDYTSYGGRAAIFNIVTEEWKQIADLPQSRYQHACMKYGDGVLVTGGVHNYKGTILKDATFYNLTTNIWEDWPPTLTWRHMHNMFDISGVPMVIGSCRSDPLAEVFIGGEWIPWAGIDVGERDCFASAVQVSSQDFSC